MREFLPWHVVQKKLEERGSGVKVTSDDLEEDESGPDSGVQESVSVRLPANDDLPLSYKVYTVADLDAAPPSSRMSMVAAAEREPSPWVKSGNATLGVLVTFIRWARSAKARPPLADAMHVPVTVLRVELESAVRETSWKKVATWAAMAVGTFGILLFAVLTVAELTDDYHAPGAAQHAQVVSTTSPLPAIVPVAQPQPVVAPVELDEEPPPPPPPVKTSKKGMKKVAAPKPEVEVFIP